MAKKNGFARSGDVGGRSISATGANTPILRSDPCRRRRAVASRRGAALLAAATVALAATVSGAEAAPYQKWVNSACPGNSSSCQIVMEPAVPANKRVQVTHVACVVRLPQTGHMQNLYLRKTPNTVGEHLIPTRINAGQAGDAYYVHNGQTLFFANPGDRLTVAVTVVGDIKLLQCKIAGAIVNLP